MGQDAPLKTKVFVILALSFVAHLGRAALGFAPMDGFPQGDNSLAPRRRSKRVRDRNLSQRSSSVGDESDVDHFQAEKERRQESRALPSNPLFSFGMIADIQYVPHSTLLLTVLLCATHASS
jgi:hypothetical protein